jgi:hypothetical protein
MSTDPNVTTGAAFNAHDNRSIRVEGTYRAIAMPRKGPPSPAAARDYAILALSDGAQVYLEPLDSPAARRPQQERARFDGKPVVVTGTAHRIMPSQGQSLIAPCLSSILSIEEAV